MGYYILDFSARCVINWNYRSHLIGKAEVHNLITATLLKGNMFSKSLRSHEKDSCYISILMRLLEYPNSKFWCYIIRAPSIASSYDMTLLGRQIDRDTAVSYSTWSGWHLFFYAQHVTSWCNKLMDWRSKWALKHWEDQKGNDHYKLKQNLQGQVPGVPFQNCNQEMDNARDRTVIPAYVMPNSSVIDSTYPDHFGAVICMAVHFFLGDNRLQAPKRFLVLQSIRCVAARKANK